MEAEERREFNRIVTEVSPPNFADIEFRHGAFGHFARITNVHGEHVRSIEHQLDAVEGVDYARTETSTGLNVEVFTTESFK